MTEAEMQELYRQLRAGNKSRKEQEGNMEKTREKLKELTEPGQKQGKPHIRKAEIMSNFEYD